MSGADIQAKVKAGLAKATAAVGSGELVYLVKKTSTGGTPLAPATVTTEEFLLENAIFKSINVNQFSDSAVVDGDRYLIASSDVEVSVNDIIRQGDDYMIVISTKSPKPSGVLLAQKVIVRSQ